MFKRLVCLVLVMAILGSGTNVSAATKKKPDVASIQHTYKPDDVWDWADGKYSFEGVTDYQGLYTNYKFTNVSQVSITVTNLSSKYDCSIGIYSVEPWYRADKRISGMTVSAGSTKTLEVPNLDSSKEYYISFGAPSKFSGYIKKVR